MILRNNLNVLGENTEKYKTFFVLIEKEIREIDKDGNGDIMAISYNIKFIASARFTVSSISSAIDNLPVVIHKINCKDCDCFLEY